MFKLYLKSQIIDYLIFGMSFHNWSPPFINKILKKIKKNCTKVANASKHNELHSGEAKNGA